VIVPRYQQKVNAPIPFQISCEYLPLMVHET